MGTEGRVGLRIFSIVLILIGAGFELHAWIVQAWPDGCTWGIIILGLTLLMISFPGQYAITPRRMARGFEPLSPGHEEQQHAKDNDRCG